MMPQMFGSCLQKEKMPRKIIAFSRLTFGLQTEIEDLYTVLMLARNVVLGRDMLQHTMRSMLVLPLGPECGKQVYDQHVKIQ